MQGYDGFSCVIIGILFLTYWTIHQAISGYAQCYQADYVNYNENSYTLEYHRSGYR